jgi:ParB-like chromosome segregation protein Spo0J
MTVASTERLGSPFSAEGVFASGVRIGSDHDNDEAKDAELRQSMQESGWLPGHPAVQDENGTLLVGNRRIAVAKELGIRPDVIRFAFGDGDAGDIKRLKMALLSNVGNKPFSRGDRQAIASYLSARGWTQQSIAEALGVAQRTISSDLQAAQPANSTPANKPAAEQAKTEGARKRAPGAGRPKGSGRKAAGRPAVNPPKNLPQAPQGSSGPWQPDAAMNVAVTPDEVTKKVKIDVQLWPLLDQGLGQSEIIKRTGISKQIVRDSRERHLGAIYGPVIRATIDGNN